MCKCDSLGCYHFNTCSFHLFERIPKVYHLLLQVLKAQRKGRLWSGRFSRESRRSQNQSKAPQPQAPMTTAPLTTQTRLRWLAAKLHKVCGTRVATANGGKRLGQNPNGKSGHGHHTLAGSHPTGSKLTGNLGICTKHLSNPPRLEIRQAPGRLFWPEVQQMI